MSLPQRSRYPRPLKATHTFPAGNQGQGSLGGLFTCATSCSAIPPNCVAVPGVGGGGGWGSQGPARTGFSSPPPVSYGGSAPRRAVGVYSLEDSPVTASYRGGSISLDTDGLNDGGGLNPRRSNSMGSLSDSDSYMNSLWPRVATTSTQCEVEEEEEECSADHKGSSFSHKRSSSCSGADRLKVVRPVGFKGGVAGSAHTRTSVEGLNQEVSSVLEGNPFLLIATPTDGRVAPVRDLLGRASVGTQTPPLSLAISMSQVPSSSSTSVPLPTSHTASTDTQHQGTSSYNHDNPDHLSRPPHLPHPPLSPKPSFAREPPDGAEICAIKAETSVREEGLVLQGPDKSKGNIIFKGNAFSPLLV